MYRVQFNERHYGLNSLEETTEFIKILSSVVELEQKYVNGKYQYTIKDSEEIKIEISIVNIKELSEKVKADIAIAAAQSSENYWYKNYQSEQKKVKELEDKIKSIQECPAVSDIKTQKEGD